MQSKSLETLKPLISGSAEITPGIPPSLTSFASMSPKVLETESLPGNTLTGPFDPLLEELLLEESKAEPAPPPPITGTLV